MNHTTIIVCLIILLVLFICINEMFWHQLSTSRRIRKKESSIRNLKTSENRETKEKS